MNKFELITREDFIEANLQAESIAAGLLLLNFKPYTSNYTWYRERCQEWDLTPPKFTKNPGAFQLKYTNEEIFIKGSKVKSNGQAMKKRLIRDYGWEDKCSLEDCPNPSPVWRGIKLTIQLDHINGNNTDNRLDNLRLICPNCHTQTDTFSGKKNIKPDKKLTCPSCGDFMSRGAKTCKKCTTYTTSRVSKIEWPDVDTLLQMIKNANVYQVGKALGVSDNAIRKHLKRKHDILI